MSGLHERIIIKHGHRLNFYNRPLPERLLGSSLGDHLLVCLVRERETGAAVFCSVNLADRTRRQLFMLVVGLWRERVKPDICGGVGN